MIRELHPHPVFVWISGNYDTGHLITLALFRRFFMPLTNMAEELISSSVL
jgi:hypothetical protein